MGKPRFIAPAFALAAAAAAGGALAQTSVTVYGRVDLSLAQQADAPSNKELRNGSGSRLGFKGVEDLGDGFKAFFHLEHRFNANDGTLSTTRFWEGKSIVGLEHWWGRVAFGREENPAYTFSQGVADPWGLDTVASNGSIVAGRIGSTRYSNTANYRHSIGALAFGAQIAEAAPNVSNGASPDKRPYSVGAAYVAGPWTVGVGHENPPDRDDRWTTANVAYDFGVVKVGAFAGSGKNASAQRHRAWLVSATAPVYRGELRASVGQLKNRDLAGGADVLDEQVALGYFYPLSKRTTLYADIVHEGRDNLPADRQSTGYDIGLKHNF
jgi:predicted porin